jgi:hypothetical protein
MSEARLNASGLYEALLQSRHLSGPSGRPLYEYRFTRDEFERMGALLRSMRGHFLDDSHGSALFVAFTAEWFRREREGGHWDWINPLAALGVHYHPSDSSAPVRYPQVRRAAEDGLARWRRRVRETIKTLHRVIAESGFPAASIRQGPRLANWLTRSVLAIEAGFSPEEAVHAESWRAGETLVQALFEPAVALCRVITELRASIPDAREVGGDTVRCLDVARPNWRTELPFDLEEQDVRHLVEDLVRARRDDTSGLSILRRLRRSGNVWFQCVELQLTGVLEHNKLPASVRTIIDDARRVRIRPGGALAEYGKAVAALERVQGDEVDEWEVRPLVQGFEAQLPLGEELRLQVIAGDAQLAEFAAFGGEPLDAPVIVLKPATEVEIGEATELEVLGVSPVRSPRQWLVLAADLAAVPALQFERQPTDLGVVGTPARRLLAFEGRAQFDLNGELLVWRSLDERQRAHRLNLVGDTVSGIREQVFRGPPQAWLMDGEKGTAISHRNLAWRTVGSKKWAAVADGDPVGRVEFGVRRQGELLAWARAEVVPAAFSMTPDVRSRTLRLSGLEGAIVAAAGRKSLPSGCEGDTSVIELADHARGSPVSITLMWTNKIEMTLPDPVTEPILLDPHSKHAPHSRLSLARLTGYRLLAPQRSTLVFELRRTGVRPVSATAVVEGLMPLAAFGDLMRQLMGGCEDLDACVRLGWVGQGDWVAEVGWYDLDQPLTMVDRSSPFAVLASKAAPNLTAFSLVSPKSGTAAPPFGTEKHMRCWLQENLGSGPWLLAGSTADGRRLRPKVINAGEGGEAVTNLLRAGLKRTRAERDAAFDECLAHPRELESSSRRHVVDLCLAAEKADVPYASIDGLRALCRSPEAAVFVLAECSALVEREAVVRLQTELPILWCTTGIDDWIMAFRQRRDRMAEKLKNAGEPTALADTSVANALVQIVDLQPALRIHAQAAFLLLDGSHSRDEAVATRLGRTLETDMASLAQELVKRHGDGADPPRSLGLAQALPGSAKLWFRHDSAYADIIAAPVVAASVAIGDLDRKMRLAACRAAWLYDRDYFESAFLCALLERAQSVRMRAL